MEFLLRAGKGLIKEVNRGSYGLSRSLCAEGFLVVSGTALLRVQLILNGLDPDAAAA